MLCVKCKKRTAVVFIQRMENGQPKQEGYCLTCARALGIKPVDDLMKQFGMRDEDLEAMEERMNSFMEEAGENGMSGMFPFAPMGEEEGDGKENDSDEEFTPGGSATFPFGFGAKGDKKKEKEKGPGKLKFLDKYCENLTARAAAGKLDEIVGRDQEIYRTIQILARRQKNNPCLIGEAGVGKTAIAEGIAQRIARGQVPACLKGKKLYRLDLTALVAGTQFRGQFEQRVKGLIDEVKRLGNVILFIDEIHSITGAGDSEGAMNAGNILKPALSRGEIQVIGATTFTEYRKFIEKDQALERRFQPVKVGEPSIADAINVLNGIKKYYEAHHGVEVTSQIVSAAVNLSERYISDRFLPDKAIDLLDEACACCNLRHPEISELAETQKSLAALEAEELAQEQAENGPDYERLAQIKTEMAQLREKLPELQLKAGGIKVEMQDVAKVVELWTGIPAMKVEQSEFAKLLNLESELKKRIIGQDEAVEAVARAMKRARADLSGKRRPASFIFVGPTGVGKTELVRQLANQLFDTPDPLIRIDMSEYMEKHTVSRLIGAPPGYVGHDEAGQLTEQVRRRPYSVVLFDEIEKAHPDVMNILLQILDEGRITDSQGRTVNFENTVICMTSNAGSTEKTGETGFAKTAEQISANKAMKALGEFLRPEFLGRVDEVIAFKPLGEESLERIAALVLDEYVQSLAEKGVTFTYTPAACRVLVKEAGSKFGARDLRRTIRKRVEDPLAERFVAGTLSGAVTLDAKEDRLELV
ncbi:MAG TPA: ATP-dependent Clp protease ATP-binding subunit [Candidatus Fournierella excrementavium]|uniref:ATP-dependent Clp protease ATP-binding subunit n=2 Tax=Candidatus Allofournierella excrementavium TaxID=2838591 RepID=UPI001F86FF8B|nr:ATP-dependent Clp protease ATP-binding subunit [Oscillospiraceae bacterium]HJD17434.1 ATP-dependent Clp protease ATP-binding subunit [Candidatus Fournierella excrementavium]